MFKNYLFKWLAAIGENKALGFKKMVAEPKERGYAQIISKSVAAIKDYTIKTQKPPFQGFDFDELRKSVAAAFKTEKDFKNEQTTLIKAMQDFLVLDACQENKALQNEILAERAARYNFEPAFFYHLNLWEKSVSKERSFEYWHGRFRSNYQRFFHSGFEKNRPTNLGNPKEVLHQGWDSLQKFNLIAQLRMGCELQSRLLLFGEPFPANAEIQLEHCLTQLKNYSKEELPAVHLYGEVYQWLRMKTFNTEKYEAIKESIFANSLLFSVEEQQSLLIILINILGLFLQKDNGFDVTQNSEQLVSTLKLAFKKKIFDKQNPISIHLFLNIYELIYKSTPSIARKMQRIYQDSFSESDAALIDAYIKAKSAFRKGLFQTAINEADKMLTNEHSLLTLRKEIIRIQAFYELLLEESIPLLEPPLQEPTSITSEPLQKDLLKSLLKMEKLIGSPPYSGTMLQDAAEDFCKIVKALLNNKPFTEQEYQALQDNDIVLAKAWLISKVNVALGGYDEAR